MPPDQQSDNESTLTSLLQWVTASYRGLPAPWLVTGLIRPPQEHPGSLEHPRRTPATLDTCLWWPVSSPDPPLCQLAPLLTAGTRLGSAILESSRHGWSWYLACKILMYWLHSLDVNRTKVKQMTHLEHAVFTVKIWINVINYSKR